MLPLFISDVPLSCINQAAYEYHVPAKLIISVLNVEQGKVGMAKRNRNGSYDLGPLQINTSWWPKLYRYQITPQQVRDNACINIQVGAWVLGQEIANSDNLLKGIGNYHSHTLKYNYPYVQQVKVRYTRLTQALAT